MTTTRYFFARIALAFGIQRRTQRMADAASESHLLREAELLLGSHLWEKCDSLDDLTGEYWNIRKINKEIEDKRERLKLFQEKLKAAHDQRNEVLTASAGLDANMAELRRRLFRELDVLTAQHDKVVNEAKEKRRAFEGIKTKLEVLLESNEPENEVAIENGKARSIEIKAEFDRLKKQRLKIVEEIHAKDAELRQLQEKVSSSNIAQKTDFLGMFMQISDHNQEVSLLHAEIGLLQKKKSELYIEIGRYLSHHRAHQNCAPICKKHRGLIEVMGALRQSIKYNFRIAGM